MEQYIIANCTDVGKARSVNEDSMVTFDSPNGRVVAVCDGMGGQAAGDVASQLACTIIRDILENNTFDSPNEAIERAILAANQGILHRAAQQPELADMGATCVMVIIKEGIVYYGWVGDSRIYYIANHTIRQISRDQSYVQQLVDRGEISPEEAENHPQKNEILNALGVKGMTPPVIGKPIQPQVGSVILLCSDGLSGMVDNAHIERTVSNDQLSLHDRAQKLVAQANANGGLDNITVQMIQFVKDQAISDKNQRKKAGFNKAILISSIFVALLIAGAIWCWMRSGDETTKDTPPVNVENPSPETKQPTDETNVGGNSGSVSTNNGSKANQVKTKEVIEEHQSKPQVKPTDVLKQQRSNTKKENNHKSTIEEPGTKTESNPPIINDDISADDKNTKV